MATIRLHMIVAATLAKEAMSQLIVAEQIAHQENINRFVGRYGELDIKIFPWQEPWDYNQAIAYYHKDNRLMRIWLENSFIRTRRRLEKIVEACDILHESNKQIYGYRSDPYVSLDHDDCVAISYAFKKETDGET